MCALCANIFVQKIQSQNITREKLREALCTKNLHVDEIDGWSDVSPRLEIPAVMKYKVCHGFRLTKQANFFSNNYIKKGDKRQQPTQCRCLNVYFLAIYIFK